jgi:hypothetical protein
VATTFVAADAELLQDRYVGGIRSDEVCCIVSTPPGESSSELFYVQLKCIAIDELTSVIKQGLEKELFRGQTVCANCGVLTTKRAHDKT